jgi:hypothetical protein
LHRLYERNGGGRAHDEATAQGQAQALAAMGTRRRCLQAVAAVLPHDGPQAMSLPATVTNSEAFAFACEWLEWFRDNASPWSAESGLTLEAGDGYARNFFRQVVRGPFVNNRLRALAIARGGEADAIDAVNEFINEMRSLGAKLPTEFEAFSMDFHAGLIVAQAPQGPQRKRRWVRNMVIALAVSAVMDQFKIPYSRRRKSRSGSGRPSARRSASAIVADALYDVTGGKIDLGEAAVERIYERMAGGMPAPGTGWAATALEDMAEP